VRDLEPGSAARLTRYGFGRMFMGVGQRGPELDLAPEGSVRLGTAATTLVKFIRRCVATHVNPETGERDVETCPRCETFTATYIACLSESLRSACVKEGAPAELLD